MGGPIAARVSTLSTLPHIVSPSLHHYIGERVYDSSIPLDSLTLLDGKAIIAKATRRCPDWGAGDT